MVPAKAPQKIKMRHTRAPKRRCATNSSVCKGAKHRHLLFLHSWACFGGESSSPLKKIDKYHASGATLASPTLSPHCMPPKPTGLRLPAYLNHVGNVVVVIVAEARPLIKQPWSCSPACLLPPPRGNTVMTTPPRNISPPQRHPP